MKRIASRWQNWRYLTTAYAVVIVMTIALSLRPSEVLLWTSIALSLIAMVTAGYHYRQRRVHKDTYLEYILMLIAVGLVLIGAWRK